MDNFYLSKKKFVNVLYGFNETHFFLFPSIIFTHEEKISWELIKGSITFCVFNVFFQVNIFSIIKDSSKEIFKQDVANIIKVLKENKLAIKDINLLLKFLQENIYIVSMIKNITTDHPYFRKVLIHHFKNCDFIAQE